MDINNGEAFSDEYKKLTIQLIRRIIAMRYRAPTQLHASLYMRDKKRSAGSKIGGDTKAGKSISKKKTNKAKKKNL